MQKKAVVVGALGVIGRYSRLHGFHDAVDSEAMFVRLLRRFRAERIVP
jgi:hypothetical protein